MKSVLSLSLAAALAAAMPAAAKEKLSYAYLQDPAIETVMWPIATARSRRRFSKSTARAIRSRC